MFGRNIRKKPPHDGPQAARNPLHQPGLFGEAHYAQPQRHDADQSESDRHRGLGAIEGPCSHFFKPVVPAADCDRKQNQCEPDIIQHARCCSHVAIRRPVLDASPARDSSRYCDCVIELFVRTLAP